MLTLEQKKKRSVEKWEKSVGVSLRDELKEEDWIKFWSDCTPLSEALAMLTALGLAVTIEHELEEAFGVDKKEQEPPKGKFKIMRKLIISDQYEVLGKEYDTLDEAYDAVMEKALTSNYPISDFTVVQEFGNGKEND